ncbi:MAG TPA: hypothetical protein VHB79_04380 [Polyangiaceae bacterium]|nr:hypothetical protein [Polyangiaceae bacterium]
MVVPPSLRRWFVFHFWADLAFALPLFFIPERFLGLLGWPCVDAAAARIAAAALFGIGIQSLLGRNAAVAEFRAMLNLKVIWSAASTVGLLWTALQGSAPWLWAFVAIFAGFNIVWTTYLVRLRPR